LHEIMTSERTSTT